MSPDSPTACGLNKTGFRLKWRAKLAPYPAPIRAAGFTLIELSIVLIVIGLIVGGVLVGQDLINAAQLRKVASEYEQYNTTVFTFRTKYDCLAGDCDKATTFRLGTNGDGDKRIDYDNSDNTVLENFYFWQQLENAGLVNGRYSGTASNCTGSGLCYIPGANVPKGALEGSMVTFFSIPSIASWSPIIGEHVMVLSSIDDNIAPPVWQGRWHNPVITPENVYSLDTKFDDGKPFTGNIGDLIGASYSPGCTASETDVTTTYQFTNSDKSCILMWKAQF